LIKKEIEQGLISSKSTSKLCQIDIII